jgi:hypothetical protein
VRRALALFSLVFAARAFGAEPVRPSFVPVQLAFSFEAPAMIAPLTARPPVSPSMSLVAAPTLMPAAPELSAPAPAEIPLAARSRPTASREDGDDEGRSQLQRLADDAGGSSRVFDASRRATKMDYEEFGRQLDRRPALDVNPFYHADAKRRILAASGYTHLYGAGGIRIPLAQASDARVGRAFLSVKKTFDRRNSPAAKTR